MNAEFRPLFRTLLISIIVPLIVVQVLLHRGVPAVPSLAIAAIFPLADAVVELVRARRIALLPTISLIAILFGIGTSFVSGNPAFAVAKESIVTAIIAVLFLGSLATKRPLIFQFARQFSGHDPDAVARLDALWEIEGFRRVMRLMTLVWGIVFLCEAAIRVVIAFTLPPALSTIGSPLVAVIVFGGLITWSVRYVRAVRRRAAERGLAVAS